MRRKEELQQIGLAVLTATTTYLTGCSTGRSGRTEVLERLQENNTSLYEDNGFKDEQNTILPGERIVPSFDDLNLQNIPHQDKALVPNDIQNLPLPPRLPIYGNPEFEGVDLSQLNVNITDNENTIYKTINWNKIMIDDSDKNFCQQWEMDFLENANRLQVSPELLVVAMFGESRCINDAPFIVNEGDGVCLMGVMPRDDENQRFPNRPTKDELLSDTKLCIDYGSSIFATIYHSENMGNKDPFTSYLWYNAGLPDRLHYAINYARSSVNRLGIQMSDEDAQMKFANEVIAD